MRKLLSLAGVAAIAATLFVASNAAAAPTAGHTQLAAGSSAAAPDQSGKSKQREATATVEVMAQAGGYTHFWGARNGCWTLNLNGLPVGPRHPLTVSATEVDAWGNEFVGLAKITVYNVAVWNGGASVWVCFDWGSPINVNLHYVWG